MAPVMSAKFKAIEAKADYDSAWVDAEQLGEDDFKIGPSSKLGGVSVLRWCKCSALGKGSSPNLKAFRFILKNARDVAKFQPDQVMDLES